MMRDIALPSNFDFSDTANSNNLRGRVGTSDTARISIDSLRSEFEPTFDEVDIEEVLYRLATSRRKQKPVLQYSAPGNPVLTAEVREGEGAEAKKKK
jgi:hypothetical protein